MQTYTIFTFKKIKNKLKIKNEKKGRKAYIFYN